jgi:hypothetical protein
LTEQAEGVRRQFYSLFRNLRPRSIQAGGVIRMLAAIPAPIGEEGATI